VDRDSHERKLAGWQGDRVVADRIRDSGLGRAYSEKRSEQRKWDDWFHDRRDLGLVFVFVEEKTPGSGNGIVTALTDPADLVLTSLIDDGSYGDRKDIFAKCPNHGFSAIYAS
jgi:hypothetical protein